MKDATHVSRTSSIDAGVQHNNDKKSSAELEDIVPPLPPAHSVNVSLGSIPSAADLYGSRRGTNTTPTATTRTQGHLDISHTEGKQTPLQQQREEDTSAALHRSAFVEDGTSSSSGIDSDEEGDIDDYDITSYHKGTNSTGEAKDDASVERRMRRTERLFDRRVRQIHAMLHAAGHQLVLRKDVISALQAQLAQLRAQLHSAALPAGAAQEALLRTTRKMMHQLQREERRAGPLLKALPGHELHARHSCSSTTHHHHHINAKKKKQKMSVGKTKGTSNMQNHTDEAVEEKRREQLQHERVQSSTTTTSKQPQMPSEREAWLEDQLAALTVKHEAALRAQERRHRRELHSVQAHYDSELAALNAEFARLDTQLRRRTSERDGLRQESEQEKAHAQSHVKTLEVQLAQAQRQRQRSELELERTRTMLQDEVNVVRLSMARLLQLLSEVPAMKAYLKWNEIDSEFVFLGYPTRYFNTHPSQPHETAGDANSKVQHTGRNANHSDTYSDDGYDEEEEEEGANRHTTPLNPVETGVPAGVYGGTTTTHTSQNIWLNGRWLAALQSIIEAQNVYSKLRRIKLFEMAQAAQVAEEGLPETQDILQCRRPEKDYWVPYRVFVEAQRFKNTHAVKLPAMEFFYPFLVRLNKIWCGRLQDRLRVWRTTLRAREQTIQELRAQQEKGSCGVTVSAAPVRPMSWRHVSTRHTQPHRVQNNMKIHKEYTHYKANTPDGVIVEGYDTPNETLAQALQHLRQLRTEHHALRSQVRLQVCSPRSLHLFHAYDALVKRIITSAERELRLCMSHARREHATRTQPVRYSRRTAEGVLHSSDDTSSRSSSAQSDDDSEAYDKYRRTNTAGHSSQQTTTSLAEVGNNESTIEQLLCLLQDTCAQVDELVTAYTGRLERSCVDFTALLAEVQRSLQYDNSSARGQPLLSRTAMQRLIASAMDFATEVRQETHTMAESVQLVNTESLQTASDM